jgi:hypothetical protein
MTGRVAILTGRSDPGRTGLSTDQEMFLRAVVPDGLAPLPQGYPFIEGALPERHVPLPLASFRNAKTWLGARLGQRIRAEAGEACARLRAAGCDAVITASCGLDLLVAGWPEVPLPVIALGPSGRSAGLPHLTTIIGRNDLIARALHGRAPNHWVPGGHMDYWSCAETEALVAGILAAQTR